MFKLILPLAALAAAFAAQAQAGPDPSQAVALRAALAKKPLATKTNDGRQLTGEERAELRRQLLQFSRAAVPRP